MIQKILVALFLACLVQPALAAGRGYLGVWFGNLPSGENVVQSGVIIKKVFAGMAGEKAGLKEGEIVTEINGIAVHDPATGVDLLAENTAGERIRLTVIDRTNGGLRRSYVFATLGVEPSSDFAKTMTVVKPHRRRPLTPSSSARHCAGLAKAKPCLSNVPPDR